MVKNVFDENGIRYELTRKLGEGGQGATYLTKDPGVLIKLSNQGERYDEYIELIDEIRSLPITQDMHIACPVYVLMKQCGYVMQMMSDMHGIDELILDVMEAESTVEKLDKYQSSGGLRRRLRLLLQLAGIMETLRQRNLVYADLSPANVFVSRDVSQSEVWLIDADNIRFSTDVRSSFGTPEFWAPEVRNGECNSMYADIYSFALLAHLLLTGQKAFFGNVLFKGARYDEDAHQISEETEDDWGVDDSGEEMEDDWGVDDSGEELEDTWDDEEDNSIYSMAEKGLIPWIGDPDNRDNQNPDVFIRPYTIDEGLFQCFNGTFCRKGRSEPHSRPTPKHWINALRNALNNVVECSCGWTYYASEPMCPRCEKVHPKCCMISIRTDVMVETENGRKLLYSDKRDVLVVESGKSACLNMSDIRPYADSYIPGKDRPAFDFTFSQGVLDIENKAGLPSVIIEGGEKYRFDSGRMAKGLLPGDFRLIVPSVSGIDRIRTVTARVI